MECRKSALISAAVALGVVALISRYPRPAQKFVSLEVANGADVEHRQVVFRQVTDLQERLQLALQGSDPEPARKIIFEWLRKEPDSVMAAIDQFANDDDRKSLLQECVSSLLVGKDIAAAIALVDQVSDESERDVLLEGIGKNWANLDPNAAWEWALTQPEGDGRFTVLKSILSTWAEMEPVKAAHTALRDIPPEDQTEPVLAIIQSWAKTDPAGAAAWVSLFPESPLREAAVQHLVGN